MRPTQLAKAAGLSASTLTRFLKGEVSHALSARTLERLSAISSVPVSYPTAAAVTEQERRDMAAEVARWIAERRRRNGWTVDYLAGRLRVPIEAVHRWEAGREQPSLEQAIDLAGLFGVAAASFLAPGEPYHGHVAGDAAEREWLSMLRRLQPDDRCRVLRMIRAAFSGEPGEANQVQRDRQLMDAGG